MSNLIDKPIGYEYYEQLMDKMKQQFVEQARDLIEKQTVRTEMDNFDAGYNTALNDIENAIRNKFK